MLSGKEEKQRQVGRRESYIWDGGKRGKKGRSDSREGEKKGEVRNGAGREGGARGTFGEVGGRDNT